MTKLYPLNEKEGALFSALDASLALRAPPVWFSVIGPSGTTLLIKAPPDDEARASLRICEALIPLASLVFNSLEAAKEEGIELTKDFITEMIRIHADSVADDVLRALQ